MSKLGFYEGQELKLVSAAEQILFQIILWIRSREGLSPQMRELVAKDYRAALVHVRHLGTPSQHLF